MLHWRTELPWQMLSLFGRKTKEMVVIFWHFYSDHSLTNNELHIFEHDLHNISLENLKCCVEFRELVIEV